MTTLELIASALGVLAVWLTVRQNPLCWPIGLVMVSLNEPHERQDTVSPLR